MRVYVGELCVSESFVLHGAHASVYACNTVAVPSHDVDVIITGVQLIPAWVCKNVNLCRDTGHGMEGNRFQTALSSGR